MPNVQVIDGCITATSCRYPMHFVSDIHGEAEAFRHLMLTRSGELRSLIAFAGGYDPDDPEDSEELSQLVTLVAYPREYVAKATEDGLVDDAWWRVKLGDVVDILYALTADGAAEEQELAAYFEAQCGPWGRCLHALLLTFADMVSNQGDNIYLDVLVENGDCLATLEALAKAIRYLTSGTIHMVGDIWDRGARGDQVMDTLMALPDVDVQWGNHDLCWMGAAAGDPTCIATLLRNNLKYGNTAQFGATEDTGGYGIDLEPLYAFAQATYADEGSEAPLSQTMKAISVLLFKCEGQAIARHPEWNMEGRLLLDKIDLSAGTVRVGEESHALRTCDFPTLAGVPGSADPEGDPYAFSPEEANLMQTLVGEFLASERLQAQIQWLYDYGTAYLACDNYLLVHGCVPLTDDGALAQVPCDDGQARSGKDLLNWTEALCRRAWEKREQRDLDWMGFFWTGWQSTFMGRVVKTFERTYIADESTWKEPEDPYYALTKEDAAPCKLILREFGLDPETSVIVNGHTPVKLPKGQIPVRGGGHRIVIDGGFCKAYRKSTSIAGYTLIDNCLAAPELVTHGEYPGFDAVLAGQDESHTAEAVLIGRFAEA